MLLGGGGGGGGGGDTEIGQTLCSLVFETRQETRIVSSHFSCISCDYCMDSLKKKYQFEE